MNPRAPYWWSFNFGSGSGLVLFMPQTIPQANVYKVCTMKIEPLGTNFSEILIKINTFHSRKCIWKGRLSANGGYFVSATMC